MVRPGVSLVLLIMLQVSSEKFSLWHSKLFPVFATRKESAEHAVNMMGILKGGAVQSDSSPRGEGMCIKGVPGVTPIDSILPPATGVKL